jgi:hypothetical protein
MEETEMTDKGIIQMAQETCKVLTHVPWHVTCNYLIPSYNALLQAAKANHPDEPFINVLTSIQLNEEDGLNGPQMNILFTQLRIALESLQPEGAPVYGEFVENKPGEKPEGFAFHKES